MGQFLIPCSRILLSPSPSPWGTLWTRSESALAGRTKIRPPCTLKRRVQQEYNSLLVNALNRIFKSNLSLKWISNGCLQNWSFRAFEILYPVLENTSEMDTTFQIRSFKITTPLGGTYPYNNIMYGSTPPARRRDASAALNCQIQILR